MPTLLIWSDADPISPVAVGRYLVTALPRAELVILAGADHMFARDRAEEIAPRIERHLLDADDSGRGVYSRASRRSR